MNNSKKEGEDLKDICPSDKRKGNAKRLIDLIESDMNNGRVLYNRLFNYSNRIVRNYHDAENVLSHFILNLINGKSLTYIYNINGSADGKLIRWLYGGVRNLSISYLRDRNRLKICSLSDRDEKDFAFIDEYLSKQGEGEVPDIKACKKEVFGVVFDNIPNLKPKYRDILTQRCSNRGSYKEISKTLHIPIGTVKSRLHIAKKKFSRLRGVAALTANYLSSP